MGAPDEPELLFARAQNSHTHQCVLLQIKAMLSISSCVFLHIGGKLGFIHSAQILHMQDCLAAAKNNLYRFY
ncbi:hypothetical protein D1872_212180 [compost metagenome]